MPHRPEQTPDVRKYAPYAISVLAALLIYGGIESLIRAGERPLQTVAAMVINAVLARAWPKVTRLNQTQYPTVIVASTACIGIFLACLGLWLGNGLKRRTTPGDLA